MYLTNSNRIGYLKVVNLLGIWNFIEERLNMGGGNFLSLTGVPK